VESDATSDKRRPRRVTQTSTFENNMNEQKRKFPKFQIPRQGVAGKDDFAIWSRKYAFVGKGSNSIFEYEKYFIYYG
jgi:hypothetical protein